MPLRNPESSALLNTDQPPADRARMNTPFLAVSVSAQEFLCLWAQSAVAGLGRSRHLSSGYQLSTHPRCNAQSEWATLARFGHARGRGPANTRWDPLGCMG